MSNFFDEELWRDVYEGPNAQEIVGSSDQSKLQSLLQLKAS